MTLEVVDFADGSVTPLDSAPVGNGSGGFLQPAISGDRVVWARLDQIGDRTSTGSSRLSDSGMLRQLWWQKKIWIFGTPLGALNAPSYDVFGDTLVFAYDLNLYQLDLSNGHGLTIASVTDGSYKPSQNPTTDGRYVYWQDYRATGSTANLVDELSVHVAIEDHGLRSAVRQ